MTTVTLAEYANRKNPEGAEQVPGLERSAADGRELGRSFESYIAGQLRSYNAHRRQMKQAPLAVNWTQPRFVKAGRRGWRPAGKGWVDLNLFVPGGQVVSVDLKAVDMGASKHRNNWVLDYKLRRDRPEGHQVATLDHLTALEHRAGVLLGRYWPARRQPWVLYFVPAAMNFNRPSIPWEDLEDCHVRNGQQWWEALR
jgi:hypothetical protein